MLATVIIIILDTFRINKNQQCLLMLLHLKLFSLLQLLHPKREALSQTKVLPPLESAMCPIDVEQ